MRRAATVLIGEAVLHIWLGLPELNQPLLGMGQTSLVCFGTGFLIYHASPSGVSQDLLDSLFQGEDRMCHGGECWRDGGCWRGVDKIEWVRAGPRLLSQAS